MKALDGFKMKTGAICFSLWNTIVLSDREDFMQIIFELC